MEQLGVSRVREKPEWQFVQEVFFYVGPEEYTVVEEVRRELAHPDHRGRLHGERTAYRLGCRGPLCKKAHRDYMRSYMRKSQNYAAVRRSKIMRFDYITALMNKAYRRRLDNRQGVLTNV